MTRCKEWERLLDNLERDVRNTAPSNDSRVALYRHEVTCPTCKERVKKESQPDYRWLLGELIVLLIVLLVIFWTVLS